MHSRKQVCEGRCSVNGLNNGKEDVTCEYRILEIFILQNLWDVSHQILAVWKRTVSKLKTFRNPKPPTKNQQPIKPWKWTLSWWKKMYVNDEMRELIMMEVKGKPEGFETSLGSDLSRLFSSTGQPHNHTITLDHPHHTNNHIWSSTSGHQGRTQRKKIYAIFLIWGEGVWGS